MICFSFLFLENINEQGNSTNTSSGSDSEFDFVTIDETDLSLDVVSSFCLIASM